MLLQPLLEQRVHFPGQAQDDAESRARASVVRRRKDAFDLGFIEEGSHWRDAYTHRDASVGQDLDRLQPAVRLRGARLRQALATQRRVTATMQRRDGRTVHLRKATRPKPRHQTLGTILKLDPNPGRTHRVLV